MATSPSRLKKRSQTSNTLALALREEPRVVPASPSFSTQRTETPAEQYWAARAVRAEVLLAAQEKHQHDIRCTVLASDTKRQAELDALKREHAEKHASVERLLYILLGIVLVLILVIIYLTTHYTRHSLSMHKQKQWWSAIGASHFTIPILSPFTSVVEHETSVIGSRLLVAFSAIFAALCYFIFRFWLAHRHSQTRPPTYARFIDR